jgi:hypothetical protein
MELSPSPRAAELTEKVRSFMTAEIEPVEEAYHRDLDPIFLGGLGGAQDDLLGRVVTPHAVNRDTQDVPDPRCRGCALTWRAPG